MSSVNLSMDIPESLLAFAQREALQRETSLDAWAQAELVRVLQLKREADDFFRVRRERAIPGALQAALDKVPNCPPDPGDELE